MPPSARLGLVLLLLLPATPAGAVEFRILAWNVESNRPDSPQVSDAETIAGHLTELMKQPETRAQIVALSEVEPKTVEAYRQAIARGLDTEVDFVTSASGGFADADTLMLVVDRSRFRIDDAIEIHRHAGIVANFNVTDPASGEVGALRARSPLAVRIRDKTNARWFWVVVNHLARGEEDLRTDQARMLRKWAKDLGAPAIAAGDFNFDYDFKARKGNAGYREMIEDGVWEWLAPDPLVDTNWADDREARGARTDFYPDSILDFVFVANEAREWRGESDVVVRPGDFPDDAKTSDHRPVIATLKPAAK